MPESAFAVAQGAALEEVFQEALGEGGQAGSGLLAGSAHSSDDRTARSAVRRRGRESKIPTWD